MRNILPPLAVSVASVRQLAQTLPARIKRKIAEPNTLAIHALVAMIQVADADGQLEWSEVKEIAKILTRLTGKKYEADQVADMLEQLNPTDADFARVGANLSHADREIILEAALSIAVADGQIHPTEYAVVTDLAHRLQISAHTFRSALARISEYLKMARTPAPAPRLSTSEAPAWRLIARQVSGSLHLRP